MASSASSSAAVAALVQKASQQYLDCRRKVTAKVEEVKALDQEITALFEQITALGEPTGSGAAAKSVGRLEVRIAGVEGETPVENAVITVALDPEYEPDAADAFEVIEQQHVVEKHTVTVTAMTADGSEEVVAEKVITFEDGVEVGVEVVKAEADKEKADEGDDVDDAEHAAVQRKTTTKIARTVQIRKVKTKVEKKEPPVRSVEWTPEAAEDGPSAFPATFVFDPVQSREAVVTITVSQPNEPEAEPVKEIEFPVSSLFQGKDLDQWYTIQDRVGEQAEEEEETKDGDKDDETTGKEEEEETTITELVDEEEDKREAEAAAAVVSAEVEAEEPVADKTETSVEGEEVQQQSQDQEGEGEAAVEPTTATAEEAAAPAASVTRFHVQATFALSQIEALSLEAVALSKKKQEAEAVLAILEREAASLRTKYERLNASQRSLGLSSVTKPKTSMLLGGRGQAPKSTYRKVKDSVVAVLTPQRQQVAVSVVMFFGSAVLFHFQGENLLA
jgi:hypothetical protein